MSVVDASSFAQKLFDGVCLRSGDSRVYDSSFPDIPSGSLDALRGKREANGADGFVPIGGEGRELRPGVANPSRYTTERKFSHDDCQIKCAASIMFSVVNEPGCMYLSSAERYGKCLTDSADR